MRNRRILTAFTLLSIVDLLASILMVLTYGPSIEGNVVARRVIGNGLSYLIVFKLSITLSPWVAYLLVKRHSDFIAKGMIYIVTITQAIATLVTLRSLCIIL